MAGDPEYLDRIFDTPDRPQEGRERRVSVKVFETETKFRQLFHDETETQLAELQGCPEPSCTYQYTSAVGFIVHNYLHLIREGDARTRKGALDKLHDILNPSKTATGEIEGALTAHERQQLMADPDLMKFLPAQSTSSDGSES